MSITAERLNGREVLDLDRGDSRDFAIPGARTVDQAYFALEAALVGSNPTLASEARLRYAVTALGNETFRITYHHIEADPEDAKVKF